MVKFPGKWKLMEFVATELWSDIGSNCVWDAMSTKLLFKHLNNRVWGGVLKFTYFNKIWEIVNNCDVIISTDSEKNMWLLYPRVYLEFDDTALVGLHS